MLPQINTDGSTTLENVPASVHALDVAVDVPGLGRVVGDVAWGGNWFFLTELPNVPLRPAALPVLVDATSRIVRALAAAGVVGRDGAAIDHVELHGPPERSDADATNFVLCPGLAYDRSPCGTGTSAKMAVLHARGRLALGAPWRQASVVGGLFHGRLERRGADLVPILRGRAFITGRTTLFFDPADPLREGFSAVD